MLQIIGELGGLGTSKLREISEVSMGDLQDPKMEVPSGKHTKNYGKSPFLMEKSTISMAVFNSYVK